MPAFTFILSQGETPDPDQRQVEELPSREEAKARAFALAAIDTGTPYSSVAVGCGEGDDIEWLGAWDRDGPSSPVWSADD